MSKTKPAPIEAPAPQLRQRRWIQAADLNWTVIFLIYSVLALLATGTSYTSLLSQRISVPFFYPLIWEFTGYYIAFALSPLIVTAFGVWPICRQNWFWTVPLHLTISVVLGVLHTLLMWLTRQQIYQWLGLGAYDYGDMRYRFLMEYQKQFLGYWIAYVALRGWAHYQQSRERERQAAALELKASQLERELAQAQLQMLRSQLNPHFLFNTLNMVSSVMYEDVDRADHMIAALSRMLRMTLEEHVDARVPMRRELDFVECAIMLLEARFQDRVSIDIRCPPGAMDVLVPNMILYTFLENSVKHHEAAQDPVMRIQARVEPAESQLSLWVLDNGPGIDDFDRAFNQGVGLRNTRQRLQALYGDQYRLELANRPEGGLQVRVTIPLERKTACPAALPTAHETACVDCR
jgi:two-component system LytT family sensor kinase